MIIKIKCKRTAPSARTDEPIAHLWSRLVNDDIDAAVT